MSVWLGDTWCEFASVGWCRGEHPHAFAQGQPESCAPARHLWCRAGVAEQFSTATAGFWGCREVSGGMIRSCHHHFLCFWCTNRWCGANFCFQGMDEQLREVWPAPFALASTSWQVEMFNIVWCEMSTLLTTFLLSKCIRDGLPLGFIYWCWRELVWHHSWAGSQQKSRLRRLEAIWGETWRKNGQRNQTWPCVMYLDDLPQPMFGMHAVFAFSPEFKSTGFGAWPWAADDPDSRRANGGGWGIKRCACSS